MRGLARNAKFAARNIAAQSRWTAARVASTYGASLTYSGARLDTNFDVFPAEQVRLHAYWLAGARLAYAVRPGIELFARATNLLDQHYQDVFRYRTEGRAAMSASGWWIGDHRREIRLGDELAVNARASGELANGGALLNELDVEPEQNARARPARGISRLRWP